MESGIITNGAVAQDGSQFNAFWRIREGIPEALTPYKAMYKYVSEEEQKRALSAKPHRECSFYVLREIHHFDSCSKTDPFLSPIVRT